MERGFDVDRGSVFRGWLKLPLSYGLAGETVEAIVDAAEDAHVTNGTVGADHRVKDHRAGDVFAHELQRVGGIDFARHGGLGKIGGGVRIVIVWAAAGI